MNRTRSFRPIRRLAGILAALATTLLATVTAAAPAAFALPEPPVGGGGTLPPPVQTIVVGGMPGWQIALIAVAAAVLAAAIAVFLDRARATSRAGTITMPQARSPPRSAARSLRPAARLGQLPLPHQMRTSGQETPGQPSRYCTGRSHARTGPSARDQTMPPAEL
jgi:hypothetical protein